METNHEDSWVADRMEALEPQWRPNAAQARQALDARLRGRSRRSWIWVAASAAAVCIAAFAIPGSRAIAQQLWDRFVLNRVDIVRVDLSRLPLQTHITMNGLEEAVPNIDEAERKAGFRPYLPPPGVLSAEPELKVSGPMHVEQTIRARDLESPGVQVPAEWDGLRLHIDIGPIVSADYPDIRIDQGRPFEFSVPSGFDVARFAEVAFRSIGVSSWEAYALGQRFGAHPFWLLDIPPEKAVNIQELMLRNGPALAIDAAIIRATEDRMYYVSSPTREQSIKLAESLP